MENGLLYNPIKVVVYNPITNKNLRTFTFIGNVPKRIQTILKNIDERTNYEELKEYYGANWRAKLGLNTVSGGLDEYGEEISNSSSEDLSRTMIGSENIDSIQITEKELESKLERAIISEESIDEVTFKPGTEFIYDISIYSEDKFSELREKIYLGLGIPFYRQHIFYIGAGQTQILYRLYIDILYQIDIRRLTKYSMNILGIPIDKEIYDERDNIRIEALDTFRLVGNCLSANNILYVVDLNIILEKIKSELVNIFDDTYQFELFYYGFIIKYFPHFDIEALKAYLENEGTMSSKYPELAKFKSTLKAKYMHEREILDSIYKTTKQPGNISLAITQITASPAEIKYPVNIRNLFDKFATNIYYPEVRAYIEYENKKYYLRKTYVTDKNKITFPVNIKRGIVIAVSLKKEDQESFHKRRTVTIRESELSRYMFINIIEDGKYYVKAVWNEEDGIDFDDVIKIISKFSSSVIEIINGLGYSVFPLGGKLSVINKNNIQYHSINVSLFWKKAVSNSLFKHMGEYLAEFIKSGIVKLRPYQQESGYEFVFMKGMTEFELSTIEKVISAGTQFKITNYYSYLTNNLIKQKWDQLYSGRITKIIHRTTDIKFEVMNIHEKEFALFKRYIINIIYHMSLKISTYIKHTDITAIRKLKKLKEFDPELYNLKKHGSRKIYSIICQKPNQPNVFTENEYMELQGNEKKNVIKFWNFTMNRPAYYTCPNKKYPHLSFKSSIHPKGYCIPCCDKGAAVEGSKRELANKICLKKYVYTDDETEIKSKYVIIYTKEIAPNRIAKMPTSSIRNLFYNIQYKDSNLSYYVFGVPQDTFLIDSIGIIYSYANILDISMEEFIKDISENITEDVFNTLLNGELYDYFSDAKSFASGLKELFINGRLLTVEERRLDEWNRIFLELMFRIKNIYTILFIDETGKGENITLKMTGLESKEEYKYVIIIKKHDKYYPIYLLNITEYFKEEKINKKIYSDEDDIIKIIKGMMNVYNEKKIIENLDKLYNLEIIKKYTEKTDFAGFKITKKLINMRNLCYAVILTDSQNGGSAVYLPIDYSINVSDGITEDTSVFDQYKYKLTYSSLSQVIDSFNEFIKKEYKTGEQLYYYKLIIKESWLKYNNKIRAMIATNGLIYYFNDEFKAEVPSAVETSLTKEIPVRDQVYDYVEINKAILKKEVVKDADDRTKLLGESLYNNYLYKMFILEFINYINKEKNEKIREKLKKLIEKTNFKTDFDAFMTEFKEIGKEINDNDITLLNAQIALSEYLQINKHKILNQIDNVRYDFDNITINRLKKLPKEEIISELNQIAKEITVVKEISEIDFPNVYIPCDLNPKTPGYCQGRKLIFKDALLLEKYIDILANDILNPIKEKYLTSGLLVENIIDYFKFDKHPNEIISISEIL